MGKCVNLFTLNGFNLNLKKRGLTRIHTAKTLGQQDTVSRRQQSLTPFTWLEGSGMTEVKQETLRD